MKSYTDLEQSKKLAEILPIESADMFHFIHEVDTVGFGYKKDAEEFYSKTEFEYIPCWSFAALLSVLPYYPDISKHTDEKWYITTYPNDINTCLMAFDNPIDACVAMIERLHEQKLL